MGHVDPSPEGELFLSTHVRLVSPIQDRHLTPFFDSLPHGVFTLSFNGRSRPSDVVGFLHGSCKVVKRNVDSAVRDGSQKN